MEKAAYLWSCEESVAFSGQDLATKPEKRGGGLSSDEDEEPSAATPYRQPAPLHRPRAAARADAARADAAQKAAEQCVALQTAKAVHRLQAASPEHTLPVSDSNPRRVPLLEWPLLSASSLVVFSP